MMETKDQKLSQGTILIITLWVLTVLSSIAISVTYRMRIELKLAGNQLNSDKVFFTAKSGIMQALNVLNQDTTNSYDILSEAWSNHKAELHGINLFRDIAVGEGRFSVSYVYEKDVVTGGQEIFYGMVDEERKINVNNATQNVLEFLPGMSRETALSIRAWRGDLDVPADILLNEDVYYKGLEKSYERKGKPFDCIEELSLVRGLTKELVIGRDMDRDGLIDVNEQGLVKYLTVYGDDSRININTAGTTVLRAVLGAGDLRDKIIRFRLGPDELLGTGDDGIFEDENKIAEKLNSLAPGEENLINQVVPQLKISSRYYTARVEASIGDTAKAVVTAVLDKGSAEGSQIVKWDE